MKFMNNLQTFIHKKLLCRYTSGILCKINFVIICLAPKWNAWCKNICKEIFSSKPDGNLKLLYLWNCKQCIHYQNILARCL